MFDELLTNSLIVAVPIWIPLAFVTYAISRKQFGLKFMFAVVTAEAIALAVTGPIIVRLLL